MKPGKKPARRYIRSDRIALACDVRRALSVPIATLRFLSFSHVSHFFLLPSLLMRMLDSLIYREPHHFDLEKEEGALS